MKWWRITLLACVLAVAAGVVSGRALWPRTERVAPATATTPSLHVPNARLNFGEVWESDHFEWILPVHNRGTTSVAVTGIAGSCQCTTVEPQQFTLAAGQTINVRVAIDLRDKAKSKPEAGSRPFSVVLTPLIKIEPGEKRTPTEWTIAGRVRPVIHSPKEVYLGSHSDLRPNLFPSSIVVESFVPLQALNATIDHPSVEFAVIKDSAVPNRYRIDLRAKPEAAFALGEFASVLTLQPIASDSGVLPTNRILLTGRILADVQADPPEILLPTRPVGDVVHDVVTLRSLTGSPFQIEGFRATGMGIAIEPSGEGNTFRVKLDLQSIGAHRGSVAFDVRTKDRVYQQVVQVYGNAVAATPQSTIGKDLRK